MEKNCDLVAQLKKWSQSIINLIKNGQVPQNDYVPVVYNPSPSFTYANVFSGGFNQGGIPPSCGNCGVPQLQAGLNHGNCSRSNSKR